MARRTSGQSGFTLLEVLVSLAITALAVGMLLQAIGGAGGRLTDTAERSRAQGLAGLLIEQALADPARLDGPRQGMADGLDWRVWATPMAAEGQWRLQRIAVEVSHDGKALARLETARVTSVPEDGS